MINAMREKYNTVVAVLGRYPITPADAREILDTVQGLCYRWAEANAQACVRDELLRERLSTADYNAAVSPRNITVEIDLRLLATYPPEWQGAPPEEPADVMGEEELYQ